MSGYGKGAPGGGLANDEPGGGDIGEISVIGGGGLPSSCKGVLGGLGGTFDIGSSQLGAELTIDTGRAVENCSCERRPGETSSPECRCIRL